jgi:hypothetical protein
MQANIAGNEQSTPRPRLVPVVVLTHVFGVAVLSVLAPSWAFSRWIAGYAIAMAVIAGLWAGSRAAWIVAIVLSFVLVILGVGAVETGFGIGQLTTGGAQIILLVQPSVRAWCRSSHITSQ